MSPDMFTRLIYGVAATLPFIAMALFIFVVMPRTEDSQDD